MRPGRGVGGEKGMRLRRIRRREKPVVSCEFLDPGHLLAADLGWILLTGLGMNQKDGVAQLQESFHPLMGAGRNAGHERRIRKRDNCQPQWPGLCRIKVSRGCETLKFEGTTHRY